MADPENVSDRSEGERNKPSSSQGAAPMVWGALGFFLAAGVTAAAWTGCQRQLEKSGDPGPLASSSASPHGAAPTEPSSKPRTDPADPLAELTAGEDEEPSAEEQEDEESSELAELSDAGVEDAEASPVHLAGAIVPQASIFPRMEWTHDQRLGYVRQPGTIAVDPNPIPSDNCTAGWYRVLTGGFICGRHVTLNLKHASIRLGTLPDTDDILPYKYGWNNTMGTPLYRSVPSKDEMVKYEPYLNKPKKGDAGKGEEAATELAKAEVSDDKKAWWQPRADGSKPEVKLADLAVDADGLMARRLVRGFFISIERTFPWNGRHWHKTTEGLVTPADRFVITKAPTFQGVELAGTDPSQPVGFILVSQARKYEITYVKEKPRVKTAGKIERHSSFRLTGQTLTVAGTLYRETTEGWWMKSKEGTYTEPGPRPEELAPGEKWIDVNLAKQTLVAFEGETPIFATLVSTGRRLKTHETPTGKWRIKHKHLASRMSGNGVAPGEAPYSIDDVPYTMFYEGSYALHAAFWHNNFGRVRSHGCTNLSPLDAKRVFFWTDPPLPEGWHGVYATEETPGTLVVVHDGSNVENTDGDESEQS